MSSSTASLFYGVCVRTADLIAASRAFAELVGPTHAIDLISHRRANGSLRTKLGLSYGAVKRVPVEVLALIRQALISEEVRRARMAMLHGESCGRCWCRVMDESQPMLGGDDEFDGDSLALWWKSNEREAELSARADDAFRAHVWDARWIDTLGVDPGDCCKGPHRGAEFDDVCEQQLGAATTNDLLARYGLCVPKPPILPSRARFFDNSAHTTCAGFDFSNAAEPVRLSTSATTNEDTPDIAFENSSAVKVKPEQLKLPTDVDLRFKLLLEAYHILPVDERADEDKKSWGPLNGAEIPRWVLVSKVVSQPW